MELPEVMVMLACLNAVVSKDASKSMKSLPTISNSLVNLGKMDVSFYFNTKELPTKSGLQSSSSLQHFFKPGPILEESCPCSNFRNIKDSFLSNPSGILNKILTSSDLSSLKEPMSSKFCCDSHEHVQEETVFFDLGPKTQMNSAPINSLPFPTFFLDGFLPKTQPSLPTLPVPPLKPKAIEIFYFPKKKEFSFQFDNIFPKRKDIVNKDIQIVGDKDLKNDFKNFKIKPPVKKVSSVKKDLTTAQENVTDRDVKKTNDKVPVQKTNITVKNPNQL